MIQIELKLFVTLTKYHPGDSQAHELKEGTSIGDLMTDLGIPHDIVKLIFVNGKKQDVAYLIEQGDRVGMFPPVGGG
jgi:molybdopterin synthase sulfur carrier subunit